jgi:hypothetical protein
MGKRVRVTFIRALVVIPSIRTLLTYFESRRIVTVGMMRSMNSTCNPQAFSYRMISTL